MRPNGPFAALLAACLAVPAAAQSPAPIPAQSSGESSGESSGDSRPSPEWRLPEELDQAFRDMMDRLKPALGGLMEMMRVFEDIDGIENYEAPEVLPNGDIIIRRRGDAPPWPPGETVPPGDLPRDPPGDSVKT